MRDDAEIQRFADGATAWRPPPEGPSGDQGDALRFIDLPSWQGKVIPARRWLVRDWIPCGCVTSLYGDGGTGKSLLAQMLMTACATGRPWLGLETAPCPAVGFLCEDDEDELLRRQDAINRALGVDFRDEARLSLVSRVADDNTLMTFDGRGQGEVTPLWHRIVAAAKRLEARLVTIDTAADSFGGDELRRSQVRQFISACLGRLAREIEGSVLLLAHPSLSGLRDGTGTGASTAWNNSVRSRLYLSRPLDEEESGSRDDDARILTRKKANYAALGDEIKLRWTDGAFEVENAPGGTVGAIDKRVKEQATEEAFLVCLRETQASGRHASHTTAARDRYAPKMFRRLDAGRPYSMKQLADAMERLFAAGRIRVDTYRTSTRHYAEHISEVAA